MSHVSDVCKKTFRSALKLKRQKTTQTGEGPHRGEICERPFIRKSDLNVHYRSHKKEMAYSCE
ncbi:hypothetical protein AVEN_209546-1, partial [Araneus ventricosus]